MQQNDTRMKKVYFLFSLFIILIISTSWGCTHYDSNKVNNELIQGKWLLIDVDRELYDSVKVDYAKELTFLIFKNNECIQYMPDWMDTLKFTFAIDNYKLHLYKDSTPFRTLTINSLSSDSLTLSVKENEWVYKKTEQ